MLPRIFGCAGAAHRGVLMNLILLIVLLLIVFGGGPAWYGTSNGWPHYASWSPLGLILLVVVLFYFFGGRWR